MVMKINPLQMFHTHKSYSLLILLSFILVFSQCNCDKSVGPDDTPNNLMVVYPNRGNTITFVDYNTLEVDSTITMDVPDTFNIFSMCLSTNKDYLIFSGSIGEPPFSHLLISYNIETSTVNIFPTGLDSVGAPRLMAAFLPDEPGLVYLYSHNVGLYSIDIFSQEINLISNEKSIPKKFYQSQGNEWIIVSKYIPGYTKDFTELEFYSPSDYLQEPNFVLNNNDQDSINVKDLAFSMHNEQLYISYLLSKRRGIYTAAYFGSYDLSTKALITNYVELPWSENPYHLAYSSKRNECYLVGAQDKFYIVGVDSSEYYLKSIVDLTGKIEGPSRILVSPAEDVAFVSCSRSGFLLVVDLENRQILKTIPIESPYLMILLQ